MKAFLQTALLGILLAVTPAWAAPTHYVLDVQGMKCAFCAYNATEQLAQVPGVQPQSVHIDLAAGKARLASDTPLPRETLAHALEQAGFRLVEMQTVSAPDGEDAYELQTVMHLEINASDFDESRFGPVLKALGAAIAEHGGRVRLLAPSSMEKRLVKSLLMGKQAAVPVHFEPSALQTGAVIEWLQPAENKNDARP